MLYVFEKEIKYWNNFNKYFEESDVKVIVK